MPSEAKVKARNIIVQKKFFKYLETNDKEIRKELIPIVKELHNHQWTNGGIYNILSVKSNCYNDCKYCYMKGMKKRFFDTDIENLDMIVDEKKVKKAWKQNEDGKVYMFPSSHDIFDEYLDEYIETCKKMLDSGNSILVVTKPRETCINRMIKEFEDYKDKVLFRLTITTVDEKIAKYYEPNAPTIRERIKCLRLLYENGYRTSVSIEPFLSNPIKTVNDTEKYVTDDIWIGVMSGINTNNEIDDEHKKQLNMMYSKQYINKIIDELKNNKKIFWKTSIMKIMLK